MDIAVVVNTVIFIDYSLSKRLFDRDCFVRLLSPEIAHSTEEADTTTI
jgi:hypothetical protein